MDRYSLILENEKDNYKIWKVLDLQTNEISYEVRDYKTGEKKFTGLSLQECKNFLKIEDEIIYVVSLGGMTNCEEEHGTRKVTRSFELALEEYKRLKEVQRYYFKTMYEDEGKKFLEKEQWGTLDDCNIREYHIWLKDDITRENTIIKVEKMEVKI